MTKKAAPKPKVLVALSGGVDSAVAAFLLKKNGYDVTAAYMINYDEPTPSAEHCWLPDYRDALRVAAHIGIPLLKLDFTKDYKEKVLAYMYAEYNVGRTPNPDVMCNKYVKFGVWLDRVRELGFGHLATGHYARVQKTTAGFKLLAAKDSNKDQTYFLHQLTQAQLSSSLFPIGGYTKPEVRKIAERAKLPVAHKEESMGICFIGEIPMKEFLEKRIPPKRGQVVMSNGSVVGSHDGLSFYTIGQRHIGVSHHVAKESRPLFVVAKKPATNELVVGFDDDPLLYSKKITIANVHWISGHEPAFPLQCEVRFRHREKLKKCTLLKEKNSDTIIQLASKERAPTPGQFAVLYKKGVCLGGGTIQ